MKRIHPLSSLCWLWLLLLSASIAVANDGSVSRADYGNTPYPIWSELSYFERSTLGDLPQAKNQNPDSLLALFLLASGVRDFADYETVRRRIQEFSDGLSEELGENPAPWDVGFRINQKMHSFFFLKKEGSRAPSGYAEEQSRLMGIFETGEFNCISSALLYAVLARHFDLYPMGVLLPSHAFIQLNIKGGHQVEVETTSPNGYDQAHDKAFYEQNASNWFSTRGLQAATYEDYLAREKVSLVRLAAQNMLNQHTGPEFMDEMDSYRLAEISAYIDPGYALAQEKRLYFYNREIHTLLVEQQWQTLERLLLTTQASVNAAADTFQNRQNFQRSYRQYLSGAMMAYANLGDTGQTLDIIGKLMAFEFESKEQRQEMETRVINSVSMLLTKLAERKAFDDGILVLSLVEGHLTRPKAWPDMVSWFYMRWAESYWNEKDWMGVIDVLSEITARPGSDESQKRHLDLMASAYRNWVIEYVQMADIDGAAALVERCEMNFGHLDICQKGSTTLEQARKAEANKS